MKRQREPSIGEINLRYMSIRKIASLPAALTAISFLPAHQAKYLPADSGKGDSGCVCFCHENHIVAVKSVFVQPENFPEAAFDSVS